MYTTRIAARSTRAIRANGPAIRRQARFYADSASSNASSSAANPAAIGAAAGIAGGSIAFYIWYQASGMASAAKTAKQAKSYVDNATNSLKTTFKENTPEPNEAIQFLHETADKYARWLPGGKQYVDKIFQDLETIRKNHAEEVDNIVRDAYTELRDVSKKGMNLQALSESWEVLQKYLSQLAGLAGDAAQDIMNNHPQMKEKLGGSFEQLKSMGDQLGPEAKKQVDETWKEVSDVLKGGISFDTADRVRKLVQDKQQQIQKLGEQAWDKGYEQVKPMLDNNPQVKQLVENNQDVLKSGNVGQILPMIQSAISSGNTLDLEKHVVNAKEKAQQQFQSGGGLSQWLNMVPQGSKILPQLQSLKSIADQKGPEAQQLAKDTFSEISDVLERRSQQAKELAKKSQ